MTQPRVSEGQFDDQGDRRRRRAVLLRELAEAKALRARALPGRSAHLHGLRARRTSFRPS